MAMCIYTPSAAVRGMLLMVGSGVVLNIELAILGKLAQSGWPDFPILGFALAAHAACLAAWLVVSQPLLPNLQDCTWLVLAGVCFSASVATMVFAVRMGLPMGDFAALNSANVVFAAFLGRAFLQERLHWLHFVAVGSTVAGAVLISKPAIIFGSDKEAGSMWLAYVLAIISGFFDAGTYICCRKCHNCSSDNFVILSFTALSSMTVFACTPLVMESVTNIWAPFIASPWEGAGWLGLMCILSGASLTCYSLAAQWCPAAVSATVDTATRMSSGYAAQVLLFDASLGPFTIGGAALMFVSVVIMALVQTPPAAEETTAAQIAPFDDIAAPKAEDDDENESLASFVAAEFAGAYPHPEALRLRRTSANTVELPARTIGIQGLGAGAPSA